MSQWVRWLMVLAALGIAIGTWAVEPPPDAWVLFAATTLDARGLDVARGNVGANQRITVTRPLRAPASRIASDEVVLDPASGCGALSANRGVPAAHCGPASPVATPIVAEPPSWCHAASPFPSCDGAQPITVAHGGKRMLEPGAYGAVVVAGGGAGPGTLVLTGGAYRFCSLRIGRKGGMLARTDVDVRVDGDAWLDNGSRVASEGADESTCAMVLRVDGRLRVSRRAVLSALACAPEARAELRVGARLFGTLYAHDVRSDRIQVAPCANAPTTTLAPTSTTTSTAPQTTTTSVFPASTSSTSPSTSTSSTGTTTTAPGTTSTSSTTSTSMSTSTTTICAALPGAMDFTTANAGGTCGETLRSIEGTALKHLVCGTLALGGGASTIADGPTPDGSSNRFSLSCQGATCSVGATPTPVGAVDCTGAGCRFGAPLPIPSGGTSTCVENTFATAASGALNLATGEIQLAVALNSRAVVTGNAAQPCPLCRIGSIAGPPCSGTPEHPCVGVCEGSATQGQACTSTSSRGLSRDCPGPASFAPPPGGTGNVCYKGPTPGKTCRLGSECGTGGICAAWAGDLPIALSPLTTETVELQADSSGFFCPEQGVPQEGAFRSGLCVNGSNAGGPCASTPDCPGGSCRIGKFCDGGANDLQPCSSAANCAAPGRCLPVGALARVIRVRGRRMTPGCAPDVRRPLTLVSLFCVPATTSNLVNGAANLPGPGATTLPGTVVLRR